MGRRNFLRGYESTIVTREGAINGFTGGWAAAIDAALKEGE